MFQLPYQVSDIVILYVSKHPNNIKLSRHISMKLSEKTACMCQSDGLMAAAAQVATSCRPIQSYGCLKSRPLVSCVAPSNWI
jgi:hypothetical protein